MGLASVAVAFLEAADRFWPKVAVKEVLNLGKLSVSNTLQSARKAGS